MRLLGENTRCELLGRHFEAEKADDCAIHGLLGAVFFRSGSESFGDVEGDVGRERRLAHRRAAGEYDQVGALKAAHHAVQIYQSRGETGQAAIAFVGSRRHFDGVGRRVAERHEAGAVFALVGKAEEARLHGLDLVLRRRVDGRIVGQIDHVLADDDQLPANRQIVDGASIGLRIDDRRRRSSEPSQILCDR